MDTPLPLDAFISQPMSEVDVILLKSFGFSDEVIARMKAAQDSMAGLVVIPKVQR